MLQRTVFLKKNEISIAGWHSLLLLYSNNQKTIIMRSILYLIAVILVIGWILGFFVGHIGNIIHILLVLAIISLLLGLIRRGSV
jgi:hypothetical protein